MTLSCALIIGACGGNREFRFMDFTPRQSVRADVLGCWALSHVQGGPRALDDDWAPAIVRLDTVRVGDRDFFMRGAVRLDANEQPLPLGLERGINGQSHWTADSTGTAVRVVFNNAFSGSAWFWHIPPSHAIGDTARGKSQRFTDTVGEEFDPRPVYAVHVACRNPPG